MALGIRDIGGEGVLIAGGGRAILLQLADPAVAAGVARHSDFAERPLERLVGTLEYVYAVVFGDEDDARTVRRRVEAAHAPVHGEPGRGRPSYDAHDPALQLWVAATLYDTAVLVFESVFGPLDAASADRVYREYAVLGTALRVPPEAWPPDRASFRAWFDARLATLEVSPDARRVARALLRPTALPAPLTALMPVVALLTAGLLPPRLRAGFGFAWSPALERRHEGWLRVAAAVVPRLPLRVRLAPKDLLLARLRSRGPRSSAAGPAPSGRRSGRAARRAASPAR